MSSANATGNSAVKPGARRRECSYRPRSSSWLPPLRGLRRAGRKHVPFDVPAPHDPFDLLEVGSVHERRDAVGSHLRERMGRLAHVGCGYREIHAQPIRRWRCRPVDHEPKSFFDESAQRLTRTLRMHLRTREESIRDLQRRLHTDQDSQHYEYGEPIFATATCARARSAARHRARRSRANRRRDRSAPHACRAPWSATASV